MGVFSSAEVTAQHQGVAFGVHNDFLAMLIECGVVGLIGYLFLLVILGWILLRLRYRLPKQHPAWSFLSVGWALFVAFAVMGISGALYTNVFVGWYYYGFIGFALAQAKGTAWARCTRVREQRRQLYPRIYSAA
jgi:O-antigen ligase